MSTVSGVTSEGDKPKKSRGKKGSEVESKYSKTVSLPQTTFDQRANSIKREPEIQKWWLDNSIYEKVSSNNPGEKFILHDGPPYANGNLHIGHALNKILKDVINRYKLLRGYKVRFVPGWDCHGLPIELKVLQGLKSSERENLTSIELRKKAASFAHVAMETQRKSFKRYGVWGDWDSPYMTLQHNYEAAQIRVFGDMVTNGHIYRGKKPVHWSPSSRTALAEAELEYPENHISKSIYVGFKVTEASKALSSLISSTEDVFVAIWTTTPWTIPANLAIAINGNLDYCIVHHPNIQNNARFIVAKDLANVFAAKMGLKEDEGEVLTMQSVFKGAVLEGTTYQHPLYDRQSPIVIGGDYITTDTGTGLVHTAPGHGQDDYFTGLKYNLPLLSPVDDKGCFTAEAGPNFEGMSVLDEGNTAVIEALKESGSLLKEEAYNHKYPYDWRTKKPTIVRATEQWFASVSNFRDKAMAAIDTVQWIPAVGKNRISSMVESRGDWCISRQRSWGVPIPVFYKKTNNEPLMTPETLKHIENIFSDKGSNAWFEMTIAELLPEGPLRDVADEYYKGTDTMDVWFDSGTSWAGVCKSRDYLDYPADIYLEGSDQHRGWFQSSLLTSVASQGIAPYKKVLTHGFVLDEKGFKMSKSLGNVVDPIEVIEGGSNQKEKPGLGADTLRLWVSGVDYSGDVCVGDNLMKQYSDTYRKLRNTLRYIVGSLNDFNPETDSVEYDKLPSIDKYILGRASEVVAEVENSFEEFQFYKVNQALVQFCNLDLSSFYLDMSKDRLYISKKDDFRRKSCQTVLHIILEQLAAMLSPIVPHLTEDLWQNIPYAVPTQSVFENGWVKHNALFVPHEKDKWDRIRLLRNDVNRCMEMARQVKLIGSSQEAKVRIHSSDPEFAELLHSWKGDSKILSSAVSTNSVDDLRFIFIASQISIENSPQDVLNSSSFSIAASDSESGVTVSVDKAQGVKCERCWYYCESVGESHEHSDLCNRCDSVVSLEHGHSH